MPNSFPIKKFYLHTPEGPQGPFTIGELRSKGIERATPVWFEGLPDWVRAEQLQELRFFFSRMSPTMEYRGIKRGKTAGKGLWQLLRRGNLFS